MQTNESTSRMDQLSRRGFLAQAGLSAAALCGAAPVAQLFAVADGDEKAAEKGAKGKKKDGGDDAANPYAPFRMSIQSYSLRKFTFDKMVEALNGLEVRFVELYPGHFPMEQGEQEFRTKMRTLRHNRIRTISYGVVPFTKDDDKNRKVFDFAKRMNLASISADPQPDSFDSLDKLVEEYKIPVAIHNHGPEDQRYRTPAMIEKAIKDHHKLIGLCIDTGHFMRVDVNPVDVAKQFKGRVFGVHLKEVKSESGKHHFKVLGEGDLDTAGLLKALMDGGFEGGLSVEYEEEEDSPVASIKKHLEVVHATLKKLKGA